MLSSHLRENWLPQERRAWFFALAVLVPAVCLFLTAWFFGFSWTIQTELDYIPREIRVEAWEIPSDLVDFSLSLPHYAFAEYFTIRQVLPPDWIFPVIVFLFLAAVSLLSAGITYLEGMWFYAALFVAASGVAVSDPSMLAPLGFTGAWVIAVSVLIFLIPVYLIAEWRSFWKLPVRWATLFLLYAGLSVLFLRGDFSAISAGRLVASWYFPLLLASVMFIAMNAADSLQGLVIILTRVQGNTQSLVHFSVFSIVYAATFLLTYLKNTGQYVFDIFYPDPFVLQILTTIAGFWILPHKSVPGNSLAGFTKAGLPIFTALAILFFTACFAAFGTGNDLMTEVLEDAITLLHFSIGFCFFLYILINFSDLMRMGLRVHEVVLKPRYMPVSGIMVFGFAGVFIFLVNSNYFPFYQALAGRYVFWGDNARREGKALQAEEMYRQALAMESRNQRANISLASLHMETGNYDKAFAAAQASLEKNPVPEAVMIMAGIYRAKNNTLEEILALQSGLRRFPNNGRLMNNAGIAFSSTVFADSALYYLERAAKSTEAGKQASANLSFLKLWKGESLKMAESSVPIIPDDWVSLNNQLVSSCMAGKPAAGLDGLPGIFPGIPEEIRPYILYHALLNKAIVKDTNNLKELSTLQDDSIRKYYSEGTELGIALVKYRGKEVYTGLNRLLGLYETSGGNRQDFGLLLGQIYYEQGSFASAAAYFRNAAKNGMQQAWYWYGVAVLDLGMGNEAAAAFRESLRFLGPQERLQVQALITGLESSNSDSVSVQSDADKSAFIKTKWNQLEDRQIKDLVFLTSGAEAKRQLWRYCFLRAYNESNLERSRSLFRFAEDFFGKDKSWNQVRKEMRPMFSEISGNTDELKNIPPDAASFYRAVLADRENRRKEALKFYRLAILQSPLFSRQASVSVQRLAALGQTDEAYRLSLDLQRLDPSNPEYLRLYALMALRMGLADFAFQCLPKYRELTSGARADSLKANMESELKSRNLPVPVLVNP